MKHFLILHLFSLFSVISNAQKVDSFYINLYTDSLKKGTHNYINVDGKMSDGSWKPLTSKELTFTTDYGTFDGNDLVLPQHTKMTKVTITVTLKSDVKKTQSKVIAIKQLPDPPLPAYDRDTEMRPRKKNVTLI